MNSIHQIVLQKRLEQLKSRQLREAEKEKAELAAVLAMQTQEVEGDTSNLRHGGIEEEADMGQEDLDVDMLASINAVPYDRSMSPEPIDTLSREDSSLAVVDQWEDWAEIVSCLFLVKFSRCYSCNDFLFLISFRF